MHASLPPFARRLYSDGGELILKARDVTRRASAERSPQLPPLPEIHGGARPREPSIPPNSLLTWEARIDPEVTLCLCIRASQAGRGVELDRRRDATCLAYSTACSVGRTARWNPTTTSR
jgi:hypothetical protein